ncbi:MAG: glycosyltransferase family 4 protein [Lachnospiraceae bacterium]|nr:glycosyltransferase family 4 protein [Lachnospiraceae bacterium]
MKILHVCYVGAYNEGWTYQENLLSKYHARLGYDVTLICIPKEYVQGKISISKDTDYINKDGVHVIRMPEKRNIGNKLIWYKNTEDILNQFMPDILFVHGPQFMDASVVAKYVKHNPNVKMYVDNHCDYSNSATNWLSKNILHKVFWRHTAHVLEPYTTKFYGVLPARVDFLVDLYHLPKEKCELLVMGGDDDYIKSAGTDDSIMAIRSKYNIDNKDFLIVTGGKIDKFKTQTLLLMEAVKKCNNRVKLIVFGSVAEELKNKVAELVDGEKVKYIGWIQPEESYNYFAAADLVVFPGRHSVFWEQVASQGIPMLVKDWSGTHHIDVGGNVEFLENDSTEELVKKIEYIVENPEHYKVMKKIAVDEGMKNFSYMEIAKRSIEM